MKYNADNECYREYCDNLRFEFQEYELLYKPSEPEQKKTEKKEFSHLCRSEFFRIEEGREKHKQKNIDETQVEYLHYRAVAWFQFRKIIFPVEKTPEEKMKHEKKNIVNPADFNY